MLRSSQLMDLSGIRTCHCTLNSTFLYIKTRILNDAATFLIGAAFKSSMPDFLSTDAIKPFARILRPVHHVKAFPSLADTGYFRVPFASEHQQKVAMREDDQSTKKRDRKICIPKSKEKKTEERKTHPTTLAAGR